MPVNSILDVKGRDVVTVKASQTVADVVAVLAEERIGSVVVVGARDRIEGIVSERDVVRGLASRGAGILGASVGEIMSSPVQTCSPADTEAALMSMMTARRIRHLPVVQDGRLAGMISIGDVVKFRMEAIEREAEEMKAYISSAG